MRFLPAIFVVGTVIALANCNGASDPNDPSLVNAATLPAESELRQEIIILFRDAGDDGFLNYELHPDNRLLVKRYRDASVERNEAHHRLLAEEKLTLDAGDADRVRRLLWRVRPENDASSANSIPLGCPDVTDQNFSIGVGFSRDNMSDLEQFGLPPQEECQSRAARDARALLLTVLRSLPMSNVDANYPLPS